MDSVPVAVDPLVTIVSVEVVDPFAAGVTVGPGLKPVPLATYPEGRFSTSSNTPLLRSEERRVGKECMALGSWVTVIKDGRAVIVKLGGGATAFTVSEIPSVCVV